MTQSVSVYIVDDDAATRESLGILLDSVGLRALPFASSKDFVTRFDPAIPGCILLDLRMPEMNGIETLVHLRRRAPTIPVIFITGYATVSVAVRAMKFGAVEFFEKPINGELLLESVQMWVNRDMASRQELDRYQAMRERLARLSVRERQVLDRVVKSMSNKEIARDLGISPKAVEIYRAHLMRKMEARSAVELVHQTAGCLMRGGRLLARPRCLFPDSQPNVPE